VLFRSGAVNYTIDGGMSNEDGIFTNLAPGKHTLQLKNSRGCSYDTVFTVTPLSDTKPEIQITAKNQECTPRTGQISFEILGADGPYDINFNNEGFKALSHYQNLDAANYPVVIRSKNYCFWDSFAVVKSNCETLYMHNAFTPNNDGHNDFIRPVFSSALGDVSFDVFNRFGQKIFESVGQTKGWDGRIGGTGQSSGSYAYIIRYRNAGGAPVVKKGTFMLIR